LLTVDGLQLPVTALFDVDGKVGTVPPEQIVRDVPKLNVGVVLGVTVTVYVVVVAHCPAVGVNVYVPDAWLSTVEGLHVPVIPFEDVVERTGTVAPAQIESELPKLKVGVTVGLTVTVSVVGFAHWPADGVNVYTAEFWLSIAAGDHVPVILFVEVVANAGTVAPEQIVIVVPNENVGVTFWFTTIFLMIVFPHCPGVGVNV
jgi:hypothetical protein